jgi:multiple sugar transport system ATP-binding protein
VAEVARSLGLDDLLDRRPRQLSGGQRQRVAMGRAIVRQPQAFLMDEPLSNLDAKLRVQMRAEISRLQRELGVTTVYVTHDQTEAMTLGDRVAVLRKGVLQQVDRPQVLYDQPVNLFVAGFIGSPAMNLLEGRFERDGGLHLALGGQRLRLADESASTWPGIDGLVGRAVAVGIRPEDMEDARLVPDHAADRRLRATADLVEALGSEVYVHFTLDAPNVTTEAVAELAADIGEEAPGAAAHTGPGAPEPGRADVTARFSPRSPVREGDQIEVAVDTDRLHVFDLDTGEALAGPGARENETQRAVPA